MYGHTEHPTLVAYVSDWITALCYYAIPAQLLYFLFYFPYKIPIRYRATVVLAGAFICLCGSSHLCMTLLQDGYLVNQLVLDYMKLATAIVSAITACVLLKLIPEGLRFVNYSLDLEIQMKRKLIELDEAHRTARKANFNKGIFISTVSHELRNPLHVITANVDFLSETLLTTDQKEYVRSVNDSALLMTSIVNDVLDMSRLQSGRMSFERIPCDLFDICSSIIKNLQQQAKHKKVSLTFDYSPLTPRFVISDSTRIHQLLLNLLTNALKFTAAHQNVFLSVTTVDEMPHGMTPKLKEKELYSRSNKDGDELDDITDATLRLLAGSSSNNNNNKELTHNNNNNNNCLSDDEDSEETFHCILPSLSNSSQFSSAARSICLDYYHFQLQHVDEIGATLDGKQSHNEHKFIHTAEEDQFEEIETENEDEEDEEPNDESIDNENENSNNQNNPTPRSKRRRARDSIFIKLTVHDHGVGISPHALAQLFTAYTQAKLSTVREFGGTGLGLSICSEIIKSMKGVVQVTSEIGRGSEFAFILKLPLSNENEYLQTRQSFSSYIGHSSGMISSAMSENGSPMLQSNNHDDSTSNEITDQNTSPTASEKSTSSSLSVDPLSLSNSSPSIPRTILVTDDNPVNVKILVRILTSLKWDVVTASDGLEAVEAFRTANQPFFCAFLDISMPNMNGYEACKTIRALGFRTPIIALTANALSEEKQKSLDAGMDEFLTKPMRKADVAKVLNRMEKEYKLKQTVQQLSRTITGSTATTSHNNNNNNNNNNDSDFYFSSNTSSGLTQQHYHDNSITKTITSSVADSFNETPSTLSLSPSPRGSFSTSSLTSKMPTRRSFTQSQSMSPGENQKHFINDHHININTHN